jgi:hypothetical protein
MEGHRSDGIRTGWVPTADTDGVDAMEESRKQSPADTERLSPDEAGRLWQHGLHLDTMLFQRGNLFLVAESLLVVSYASMLGVGQTSASDRPTLAARVIAVFGLLLTLAWGYVGHRHLQYYGIVSVRMRAHLPEYRKVRDQWRKRGVSSLPVVTYLLPMLAAIVWALLLLITWR